MELRRVTFAFGDKAVLEDFSIILPKNGVVCLSGPSGCGKTTLLRIMCGLEVPQEGEVIGPVKTAVVFQEDRLLPWLTVEKNLTVAANLTKQQAVEWLQRVGLAGESDAKPENLSGGMRRRVAIARALGAESELLLLDEPFTGLDADTREALYPFIRQAAEEKPVVLVTHHPEEAEALGAKVIKLDGPPLRVTGDCI